MTTHNMSIGEQFRTIFADEDGTIRPIFADNASAQTSLDDPTGARAELEVAIEPDEGPVLNIYKRSALAGMDRYVVSSLGGLCIEDRTLQQKDSAEADGVEVEVRNDGQVIERFTFPSAGMATVRYPQRTKGRSANQDIHFSDPMPARGTHAEYVAQLVVAGLFRARVITSSPVWDRSAS